MAMSKPEAINAGFAAGEMTFSVKMDTAKDTAAFLKQDREELKNLIRQIGNSHATNSNLRYGSVNYTEYVEAFVRGFMRKHVEAHSELPDVKAERRIKSFAYILERMKEDAEAAITKFTTRLASDPFDAFSWGETAMAKAAELKIVKMIERAMSTPEEGAYDANRKPLTVEEIVEWAGNKVIEMARSTSSSTSQPSNIMTRNELAAWARIAEFSR